MQSRSRYPLWVFLGITIIFTNIFSEISEIPVNHLRQFTRKTSYPLISWETFRSFADFVFDFKYPCNFPDQETEEDFDPNLVKNRDIIFVHSLRLNDFFKTMHKKIKHAY